MIPGGPRRARAAFHRAEVPDMRASQRTASRRESPPPVDLGGAGGYPLRSNGGTPMRAVRIHECGGLDNIVIDDIPRPEPGDGEVMIEVRAVSLNHLDIWVREGKPAPALPHTLGSDA